MAQKDIKIVEPRKMVQQPRQNTKVGVLGSQTLEAMKKGCSVNTRTLPAAPDNVVSPGSIWIEKQDKSEIFVVDISSSGIVLIATASELSKDEPTEAWVITQKGLMDKYTRK